MYKATQKITDFTKLDAWIDTLETKEGMLIATLHEAQDLYGFLPREVQEHVALALDVPTSTVYGVVSFYSFLRMEPRGKADISVCLGTACFVRGAGQILEEFESRLGIKVGEISPDGHFSLNTLRCVGACSLAPVVMVNDRTYGGITVEDVSVIIDEWTLAEGGRR